MHLKILASLKRKYGPLPLWVWTLIVGGAGALWWRYRHPSSAAAAPADQTGTLSDALAYGQPDYGDTGTTGTAAGAPADAGISPDFQSALGETQAKVGDLYGRIQDLETAISGIDTGAAGGTETQPPDGVPPEPTGPPSRLGVAWGGQRFLTKQGIAKWLSMHNPRLTPAQAYAQWAKRHPAAAATLAGAPPKSRPPAPPKPKPKPSPHAPARAPAKPGAGRAGARGRATPAKPAGRAARPRPAPAKPKPKPKPAPRGRRKR